VPKTCVVGQGLGLHVTLGWNAPALGHWAALDTAVHWPSHAVQHAPDVGGGQVICVQFTFGV